MTIAVISHENCLLHNADDFHPERAARIQTIDNAIRQYCFQDQIKFYRAPKILPQQLLQAHTAEYIAWLSLVAPKNGRFVIDSDTIMNSHTLDAAMRAAGSVIKAVDLVLAHKAQAAFCNIRPPGHHAERAKAMGFCFFNNVAAGVLHALETVQRVAIIDFDVHHGNGTQSIFQTNQRVLYCSSFQHPFYPGYDCSMDNEHLLNVPLAFATTSSDFRKKVASAWFEKIECFKPNLIIFSAGFDGHKNDGLANILLGREDYVWLTAKISFIAKRCGCANMISVLEGGYNLRVLSQCVPAHIDAML